MQQRLGNSVFKTACQRECTMWRCPPLLQNNKGLDQDYIMVEVERVLPLVVQGLLQLLLANHEYMQKRLCKKRLCTAREG